MSIEHDFYQVVLSQPSPAPVFKLASIPGSYSGGQPTLLFDGETTPTAKHYTRLAAYTPAAGDRVLVALVGSSGVILGKVV